MGKRSGREKGKLHRGGGGAKERRLFEKDRKEGNRISGKVRYNGRGKKLKPTEKEAASKPVEKKTKKEHF